jgi:FdrA protein
MTLEDGLDQPLRAINVGLELFAEQLEAQGATVLHVDWRPPAGGSDIAALLAQLEDEPS